MWSEIENQERSRFRTSGPGIRVPDPPAPASVDVVNIIVHGFGIIKVQPGNPKSGVTLMLPDIKLEHTHVVGSYYSPAGPVVAINVDGEYSFENLSGPLVFPLFDRTVNAVIRLGEIDTGFFDGANGYRRIRLPYPLSVRSLKCRERADHSLLINGTDAALVISQPKVIALTHVLTYGRVVGQDVKLKSPAGNTIFTVQPDPRPGVRNNGNCHVHNSFAQTLGPAAGVAHAQAAFRLFGNLTKTSGGANLRIGFNIDASHLLVPHACCDSTGGGVDDADLKDLGESFIGPYGANCLRLMVV